MTPDRPVLGILLMLGFCVLAPLSDAVAKILGATIPLGQLVFARFAVQAVLLIPLVMLSGMVWRFSPRAWRLTLIRTVLHIFGIGGMFTSLQYLPLADAVAIVFVMPFFMLLLGRFVLNEDVGPNRLAACIAGFIGTMMVIQPNLASAGFIAFLPVGVAIVFAFFMLVTRQIAKEVDPIALQAVSGVMAMVILAPFLLLGAWLDFAPLGIVRPEAWEWQLLLAIGALGTGAHLLMTWSLRFAPSTTVAPMQYLEIPVAAAVGFFLFNELPNTLAGVGITLTVASGVYVVLREQAIARRLARSVPPTA